MRTIRIFNERSRRASVRYEHKLCFRTFPNALRDLGPVHRLAVDIDFGIVSLPRYIFPFAADGTYDVCKPRLRVLGYKRDLGRADRKRSGSYKFAVDIIFERSSAE